MVYEYREYRVVFRELQLACQLRPEESQRLQSLTVRNRLMSKRLKKKARHPHERHVRTSGNTSE